MNEELLHQIVAVVQHKSDTDFARLVCICGHTKRIDYSHEMETHIKEANKERDK